MAPQPTEDRTEQETIDAGRRIESIVQDDIFKSVVARYLTENMRNFKIAKTTDAVLAVHARSVAMQEFLDELQGVIDHGEAARIQRKSREDREAQTAAIIAARKKNAS